MLEKVGGNDNHMLSEQIVAIVDKLLEENPLQQNNTKTLFQLLLKKVSVCGLKILYSGLDLLHI